MKQVVDLQEDLGQFKDVDVQVLAVSTDSVDDLREMAAENDVSEIPLLSDGDTSVSRAYGVLGKGMHSDKPGHTFVLVDKDGRIRWRKDYSEMYVPVANILTTVRDALGD